MKANEQTLLSVDNLTVGYDKPLISSISFQITHGQSLGIIGPNGAGKSTLVRTILGLQMPLEGSVSFLGSPVRALRADQRILLSYVPQRATVDLSFPVTLHDVVYMSLLTQMRLGKMTIEEVDARIQSVLSRFGFNDIYVPLRKLSGGQLQRLLIARALVNEPMLTIMDEPTSNLDPAFTDAFYNILDEGKKHGKAFIIVSHDLEGVRKVVDKCLIINFDSWELREHA